MYGQSFEEEKLVTCCTVTVVLQDALSTQILWFSSCANSESCHRGFLSVKELSGGWSRHTPYALRYSGRKDTLGAGTAPVDTAIQKESNLLHMGPMCT